MKKVIGILCGKIFTNNDLNHKIFSNDDLGIQKQANLLTRCCGAFSFIGSGRWEISCFLLLLYFLGNQIEGYGFSLNAFNLSMSLTPSWKFWILGFRSGLAQVRNFMKLII